MKQLLIKILLATLAGIVLIFVFNSLFSKGSEGEVIISDEEEVVATSSPEITLEYLQAQPEWNPTSEVVGIKRIENSKYDSVFDKVVTPIERSLRSNNMPQSKTGYSLAQKEVTSGAQYCNQYKNTDFTIDSSKGGSCSCLQESPEKYNELIVLDSKNTILHYFKAEEGYSFIANKAYIMGDIYGPTNFVRSEEDVISLNIFKWNDFDKDLNFESKIIYNLNLATGEITLEN